MILIVHLNAQIHFNRTNLASQCYCDPVKAVSIYIPYINIKDTFNDLSSLQKLWLGSNQISSFGPTTFNGLSSLLKLELSHNKISFIDPDTFNGISSLFYLWLQNNKISQIEVEVFKGLINLYQVNLESNKIVFFNKNYVCLFANPVSVSFPDQLSNICSMNPKCKVYISSKCF